MYPLLTAAGSTLEVVPVGALLAPAAALTAAVKGSTHALAQQGLCPGLSSEHSTVCRTRAASLGVDALCKDGMQPCTFGCLGPGEGRIALRPGCLRKPRCERKVSCLYACTAFSQAAGGLAGHSYHARSACPAHRHRRLIRRPAQHLSAAGC